MSGVGNLSKISKHKDKQTYRLGPGNVTSSAADESNPEKLRERGRGPGALGEKPGRGMAWPVDGRCSVAERSIGCCGGVGTGGTVIPLGEKWSGIGAVAGLLSTNCDGSTRGANKGEWGKDAFGALTGNGSMLKVIGTGPIDMAKSTSILP